MADGDVDAEEIKTMYWLKDLNSALENQKEMIEIWCSYYISSLQQAKKRSKASHREANQATPEEVKSKNQADEVDISEIDKILARAKHVRVRMSQNTDGSKKATNVASSKEPRVRKAAQELRPSTTVISSKSVKLPEQRAASSATRKVSDVSNTAKIAGGVSSSTRKTSDDKTKPSGVTKQIRGVSSATMKGTAVTRPLYRPKNLLKMDEKQDVRRKDEEKKGKEIQVKAKEPHERNGQISIDERNLDHVNPKESIDMKTDDGTYAEGREISSCLDPNVSKICTKIRNLKQKLTSAKSNFSNKNQLARRTFLMSLAKAYCFDMDGGKRNAMFAEQNNPEESIKRRLGKSSPVSEALDALRLHGNYIDVQELQNLFHVVLKYIELEIELEGKIIIYEWASKILKSDALTRSEKIDRYRKFHSLLLENGKRLPTMIDDSEVDGLEAEDDESNYT